MNTAAVEQMLKVIRTRRALLSSGLGALALAVIASDQWESAARNGKHRRQERRDRRQRRRRNGGNNGRGDGDCTVCASGCPFSSIQAAIDADQGSSLNITVCPGTYKETLVLNASRFPSFTIVGAGEGKAILDANGAGPAITVGRGTITELRGMTITGGKADFGAGILNRGNLTIEDSSVTGNDTSQAAGGGAGIYNDGGTLNLASTTVSANASEAGKGGGILNSGGSVALTVNSHVTENKAKQGGGILNVTGGTVTIDDSSSVTNNQPDNCVGTTVCGT